MKIFLTRDLKEIDNRTIKEQNISSLDLMERAAIAATDELMARWDRNTNVILFAGPGNNGGDTLAIARLLNSYGYNTTTYLFNPKGTLSPDCQKNKEKLLSQEGVKLFEITKEFDPPELTSETLVVDGLFGVGLNAPIEGGFASVIQYINSYDSTVVAIDIPSGLFGENNSQNLTRNIIKAQLTLTFETPKLAFMFPENEKYTGEVVILDINLSKTAKEETSSKFFFTERSDVKGWLNKRNKFSHKGIFGNALLVAGSYGMMGAAVLAAKACMRTGVGVMAVHGPECGYTVMQTSVPEARYKADKNPRIISIIPDMTGYNAIGIGPGIGMDNNTGWVLRMSLKDIKRPLVMDADALNFLASNKELLNVLPANTILTPHPKEFERLFGKTDNGFERLEKAIEMAMHYNLIIVLKGAYTAVCLPNGEVHFNSTGNPGMATAGSGDVLTGIILSLLAQNYLPEQAAILGVYIHGLAGDLSLSLNCEESMIASDIVNQIGNAIRQLKIS